MSATAGSVRPVRPANWGQRAAWWLVSLIVVAAFWSVRIKWSALLDFPGQSAKYLRALFVPPAWHKAGEAFSSMILSVQMAWFGTVLGIVVSFPLSFLAARPLAPLGVRLPLRGLFAIIRAVPEVVTAILILSVTGLTPFTGALALAIGSIGTLGKWGYEAFEAAESGPLEAIRTSGGGMVALLRWGVWPSSAPEVLSFWLYRFEINVRASAILGLIGAGGIGKMLQDNVQFRNWDVVGMLLLVVIIVTMAIDQISGAVRVRLVSGRWELPLVRRLASGGAPRRKGLSPEATPPG
ncbi:phosphonate transport system permease protein [Propionibacterium cyclohexanicum]|mgnify:CR=1 FL=1|uniref:Phosphonate transport system permease protein n=1 Tax=Propionibacterium cyclohexanicum TaxID=64702 RepID=A0A1H9Q057_9ACTN|nr:phosphonate ABC transporter, permease protein PhnE [Propionibacterium cyclohexanicum]SER53780.1 phosphonate transport system permease protein [Propionibacterium cyclohexanicum]